MSARAKKLVVIGVFILSMALVLVLLIVTKPKDEPEADVTETDNTITVMPYLRDDVAQMTVHNESGEYTIRNGVSGFVIDEFNGFRQNSTTMGAAARCAAELKAEALVEENAENLDKYGLSDDNPKSRCDVTLKDGTAYTLYFGIDAPDGETRYVRKADSKDVYTVLLNSSGYMYYSADDFISLAVTDELTNNNTAPTLDHMVITRKDLDYDIEFIDDSKKYNADDVSMASSQVMISPVYAYLDITNSNAIMYGFWGLTALDVVKVHPTADDFKEYGLDDPFCEVNLEAELQVYNMKIGNVCEYQLDENGNPTSEPYSYYCYYNGVDIIYVFAASEVPWAVFSPIDILSTMMTSNYIYTLDFIDISFIGDNPADYHFELKSDLENTVFEEGDVNGVEFNGDDFKIFYQFLLKCPIDDLCFDDPPEEDLIARIDFRRDDGDGDILEFYDLKNGRVAIKLNGTTSFSQPIGYLNVLRQNIDLFVGGATGDELIQVW